MNHKTYKRFIRRRLQNIGVPQDAARQVSDNFVFQLRHQGDKGAITFIKRCGDTLLNYLYGTPQKAPWVRTVHRFPVFFQPLKGLSETVLLRVSKLARAIRFATIQPEQVDKVVSAVVTPFGGSYESVNRLSELMKLGFDACDLHNTPLYDRSHYSRRKLVTKAFKKVQSVGHQTENVAEPPVYESLQILADHPDFRVEGFEDVFYPLTPTSVRECIRRLERPIAERTPYVGEIHSSQEGAGKLRMFASPYTVLQCILYPLHFYLDSVRSGLPTDLSDVREGGVPTDCTHNQEAGALVAQRWLQDGRTVHSVDLSTATCRFPLLPQIRLLEYLRVPQEEIALLEYVCRGEWWCGVAEATAFAVSSLQWQVGQPLGIAPSMSMFSLAHNLLLWGLCVKLHLDPMDTFRVLGDDVIIANAQLAKDYMCILESADIPVSYHKSHTSNQFAEFAGYSITPTVMVRPGQWRRHTHSSVLSLSKELKTPLTGEVSILATKIQQVYLFSLGLFDPPPTEWPYFVKLSTKLALRRLEDWTVYNAPVWYYKIMQCICDQFGRELDFFYEEVSMSTELHSFLKKVAVKYRSDENDRSNEDIVDLLWWQNQCLYDPVEQDLGVVVSHETRSMLQHPMMVLWDAYQALNLIWMSGAIPSTDFIQITEDMLEVARSLLFLPPRRAVDNELDYLAKQLCRLIKKNRLSKSVT